MTQPGVPSGGEALGSARLQDAALRGAAWTMIHTVISVPIAFLVNLLLARILAPEGYGRLAFLTTLITLASSILALGLAPAMIQFGAKAHAARRGEVVTGILASAQGFRLLIVAPVITIIVLFTIQVPWILLVLAIMFGVWVPAFLNSAPIAMTIENRTATNAKIALVSNLMVQVGVVTALLWFGTADSVWVSRVILTAIGMAPGLWLISHSYRRAILHPRLPTHFPPGFWRFAIPTGVAGLIGELVVSRTEVLFIQWLGTPTAVGIFALAFGVSSHIFAPAQALTGPLVPAVSGLREISPTKVVAAFLRTLRASSIVTALIIAGTVPALALLVPLLYGEEYRSAAPAVLVLGVIGGFAVTSGPLSAFILARLSARLFLVANIMALVVDVILALTLIPALGLWGAVIANGAGTITRLSVLLVGEVRALELKMFDAFSTLLPAVVAAVGCGLAWFTAGIVPAHVIIQSLFASVMALAFLLLGMRATRTGLTAADKDALLKIAPLRLKPPFALIMSWVEKR